MRRRGYTFVEVIVSLALLSLLLLVMTVLYIYSLRANEQSYRQTDDLAEVQAAAFRLAGDVEPAAYRSISFAGDNLFALLSGASATHSLEVDTAGHVSWQRYVLYSWNATSFELWRREIPLPAHTVFPDGPVRLEQFDFGSGTRPLGFYDLGSYDSRKLASDITAFHAEKPSGRLVNVRFTMKHPNKPEQQFECTWRAHN